MIEARKAKLLIKRHCEERVRAIERGGVLACATVTRAKDPLTPSELRGGTEGTTRAPFVVVGPATGRRFNCENIQTIGSID